MNDELEQLRKIAAGGQIPAPVAIVRDYAELHAALRARAEQLELSRVAIDDIAGLTAGHTSKLLAPVPIKFLGRVSLGPILGALGLAIVLVDDPEARARAPTKRVARQTCHVGDQRTKTRWRLQRHLRDAAILGGVIRAAKLSPEQRRKIAKKAARARWKLRRARALLARQALQKKKGASAAQKAPQVSGHEAELNLVGRE